MEKHVDAHIFLPVGIIRVKRIVPAPLSGDEGRDIGAPGGNAAADKRADASPNGGAYTAAASGGRRSYL